jgi:hypothetical protein
MTRTFRNSVKVLFIAAVGFSAVHAGAQQPQQQQRQTTITFYENEDFANRWFSTERRINNFERYGFNDRANSVKVRGGRWEVCTAPRFEGRCVVLRRGDYPSLREAGLEERISSARPVTQGSRDWNRRGAYDRNAVPDRR